MLDTYRRAPGKEFGTSSALACPACGSFDGSAVMNSRPGKSGIKRRRRCLACNFRFTTWEIIGAFPPQTPVAQLRSGATMLRQLAAGLEKTAEDAERFR